MSHADTYVHNIHAELQGLGFPVSDCIVLRADDPQGNFGIAWYFGRYDGCGHMAYDEGYLPTKHTVVHEFGHDMHSRWQASNIMPRLWSEVGFPVSMDESVRRGSVGSQPGQYTYWRHTPAEMLADLFAWTVLGDFVQTEMHGVPLTDALRSRLAAFFKSFKEEDVALSTEDKAWIVQAIAESEDRVKSRLAMAEVDILREVTAKLDSGFNTTVSTFIDRHSAGDKKVATAEKD